MIIGIATITQDEHWVTCTIPVSCETSSLSIPEHLIYKLPVQYEKFINPRSDAFAAGLLPLAMAISENIECAGALSERLCYGMGEVIKIWSHWTPQIFRSVSINAERLVQQDHQSGTDIGCAFSGGADSLRLLQSHLAPEQRIESLQMKHCVFVQGFDIPLTADEEFNFWTEHYSKSLLELGVNLIPIKTNLHSFTVGAVPWRYAHGFALISIGLLLEPLFKQFLIASTCQLSNILPYGSSIVNDHWFSTENMAVRYHGIYENRLEKIEAIAHWQPAKTMLRVCIDERKRKPGMNCCHCIKCKRTMVLLHLMGVLKDFNTFPESFSLYQQITWVPDYSEYYRHTLAAAWHSKKLYILPILLLNGFFLLLVSSLRHITPGVLIRQLKRKLYPVEKDSFFWKNLPPEWL